jgi:uncharacterized protein YerC
MPRASKKYLTRNVESELKDHFAFLITSLQNSREIEHFFYDFLSKEEKVMLAKRLMLHLMLEREYKVSEISSVLGITRETIRVHRQVWIRGGTTYKKILQKIARREQTKEFWKKINQALNPIELVLHTKTNKKARIKLLNPNIDS